ncbi:PREDICTED: putative tRNA pseudouridine synthase Pus10 [Tarenaya hassleriana]|uniref:putative tRNA pseudouridine synthase Pus10 n=1 Tax=Tarenaya hassleriana TaxID=28532 RepID=UPI00053C9AE9|nr:PREDICTED: putative tRNA pseudouridine synthase Pus10 [Tarenaya hassleriana]XP_010539816.1 PREDICTED: putative tRNA pseudouridine synthase Pus10 [Tarenaya hassleriana]
MYIIYMYLFKYLDALQVLQAQLIGKTTSFLEFQKMSEVTDASCAAAASTVTGGVPGPGDNGDSRGHEAAQSIHSDVVKDLLSLGVCERCIFRLVAIRGFDSVFSSVSTSTLRSRNAVDGDTSVPSESDHSGVCIVCLGVLQFIYSDDKQTVVKMESNSDFATRIAEFVKQSHHEFDSFGLEVSVPSVITENESAVMSYLKGKYESEVWLDTERTSVKDALKNLILDLLKNSLDAKSDSSPFRIRLTYTNSPNEVDSAAETKGEQKRRRTDKENGSNCMLQNSLKKVYKPCSLEVLFHKMPIYFGGRYLKFSRNVSQTRWIIDDERMGEASVEEIIGSNILPACFGDNYKFHAAGREDIDVRMLGSGRPFLLEIQNPRRFPSVDLLKEIEAKMNNLENKLVGVRNLTLLENHCWNLMREGEGEKRKQYAALVWISRPLEDKDLESISSLKELKILQRTPVRVLHRRSPLDREKIIHWMNIEKIEGNCQYFLLHLCTQAGTYIKEFVHGDLGRTSPSIGSILGCRVEILQLDVTDVKMDFLDD